MRRAVPSLLVSILSLGWIGCVDLAEEEAIGSAVAVPPRGAADTLDIGEWNIEWFGSTGNGPRNESLQLANARDIVSGADLDLWGLEEIVGLTQFNQLKSLTGYAGFLANDPMVASGSTYYSSGEQKVGILYKPDVITVRAARIILTANDYDFAGRPPLEVEVTATIGGVSQDLVLIVFHAKAFSDTAGWTRRLSASNALKAYLDGSRPNDRVILVGDYNDDLDTSITSGKPSPYQSFVDDTARYFPPTKVFSDTGQKTTVSHAQAIDHHIVTNELAAGYVDGSAEVYRVDQYIASYGSTTSDHYPTLTRYSLGVAPPPPPPVPAQLILNEILANEPGSVTAGEFVEIVNVGGSAADLSGFTVSDGIGVRHTFAAGTTLAAGKAIVVFGGASAIPGGITAVAASSGTLGLGNGGDTVTLRDAAGSQVDRFAYPSALSSTDGVSMNRDPDADAAGTFVLHSSLSSNDRSAGIRANGAAF
jgi:endonuclease/exonuclease/phosphatase family metal-dependent hydrolase